MLTVSECHNLLAWKGAQFGNGEVVGTFNDLQDLEQLLILFDRKFVSFSFSLSPSPLWWSHLGKEVTERSFSSFVIKFTMCIKTVAYEKWTKIIPFLHIILAMSRKCNWNVSSIMKDPGEIIHMRLTDKALCSQHTHLTPV